MLAELLALEMSLGGGGQLLNFDGITLRYAIVATAIFVGFYRVMDGMKIPNVFCVVMLIILLFVTSGIFVGLINGHPVSDVITAASQFAIWIIYPYLIVSLSVNNINKIDNIFVYSGLFLAVLYITYQIACFFDIVDPFAFFQIARDSSEFFFRGNQYFFYKGFVYFAVSAVLINSMWKEKRDTAILILFSATALMAMRGFIAALMLAIFYNLYMLDQRKRMLLMALVGIVAIGVAFYYVPGSIDGFEAIREASDNYRANDLNTVVENVGFVNLLLGDGFGSRVNDRLFLENSYVDIFVKTGVIGLLLYLSAIFIPFISALRKYRSISCNRSVAYFTVVVFLLLVSLTNPFINNTIGIFLIMYFSIAFNVMKETSK